MKEPLFKFSSNLFNVLITVIAILVFASGYFIKLNYIYKNENRKLIIQNDSIISVNMELKDMLHNLSATKTSLQSSKSNN